MITTTELDLIIGKIGINRVLLPCVGKAPLVKKWNELSADGVIHPQFNSPEVNSVGVRLGKASNGLCTIDADTDEFAEQVIKANPYLANTLITKGQRGRQFWIQIDGDFPSLTKIVNQNNVTVGEWRADGGQSIIRGIHPTTQKQYQWINTSSPITTIKFEDIKWPRGYVLKSNCQTSTKKVSRKQNHTRKHKGGSESEKHKVCSSILSGRSFDLNAPTVAALNGVSIETVKNIWGKYPQLYWANLENLETNVSLHTGKISTKHRKFQRTRKFFSNRWWAFEDLKQNEGLLVDQIKDAVFNRPAFDVFRKTLVDHKHLQTNKELKSIIGKEVDLWHEKYGENNGTFKGYEDRVPVAPNIVTKVENALKAIGDDKITIKGIRQITGIKSEDKITRALHQLGYCARTGRGACWTKNTIMSSTPCPIVVSTPTPPPPARPHSLSGGDLYNEIKEKLEQINLLVITGPAGSGKTTLFEKQIWPILQQQIGSTATISRTAYYNTIANGLSIATRNEWGTIHKALQIPIEDSDWEDIEKQLDCLVVDEFSLVSTRLFWKILRRLKQDATLVIMGDPNQLPPSYTFEGDYPLRDIIGLIDEGILKQAQIIRLSENKRAKMPQLQNALNQILKGKYPYHDDSGVFEIRASLGNIEFCDFAETEMASVQDCPHSSFMCLSTLKGAYGCKGFANMIVGRSEFRIGDDVLINEYGYRLKKASRATIIGITPTTIGNSYRVMDERGQSCSVMENHIIRPQCRHVHAVQGLEADGVLGILEYSNHNCCSREALYVMVSRARYLCRIATTEDAVMTALSRSAKYIPSLWAKELGLP